MKLRGNTLYTMKSWANGRNSYLCNCCYREHRTRGNKITDHPTLITHHKTTPNFLQGREVLYHKGCRSKPYKARYKAQTHLTDEQTSGRIAGDTQEPLRQGQKINDFLGSQSQFDTEDDNTAQYDITPFLANTNWYNFRPRPNKRNDLTLSEKSFNFATEVKKP
ncbi:hypothetical protein JTE90_000101 [Oedothorax gibbosus]|uniref:GATA-type domain-containing protein n=1 Tax=Oedothorax gibbosus TaxID=931172 RepID=A0AAV6TIK6_9ARAC|nr:hypothetical protein JTE90_000101 [Oedothorax gibbosus]